MASSTAVPHANGLCATETDQWELPTVSIVAEEGEKSGIVWPPPTNNEESSGSKALYDLSAVDFSIKLPKTECSNEMSDHRTSNTSPEHNTGVTLYDLNRNPQEKVGG